VPSDQRSELSANGVEKVVKETIDPVLNSHHRVSSMFIERLIIAGFKSYREHTSIDGFDQFFNATTGPTAAASQIFWM
jgi:hypothetical protein